MDFIVQNLPALICVLVGIGLLVAEAFMQNAGLIIW